MKNKLGRLKKRIVCGLVIFCLLTGCGKTEEVPELKESLKEPVVNNEAFRPVEYGSAAQIEIEIADVVPEEYCHFLNYMARISEIKVDLGQYVKKGDLLASVDVSEIKEELQAKERELALQMRLESNQKKIYWEKTGEQKFLQINYRKKKNQSGIRKCKKQIAILQENRRYDSLLSKHRITALKKEIETLKAAVKRGSIRARHEGYVTYVKNLVETDCVEALENIVIVSDKSSLHLELQEDISSDLYASCEGAVYDQIYIFERGRRCLLKLYEFSNREMIAVQSSGQYPRIRLELEKGKSTMECGDKVPVYLTRKERENVLLIGTDSLYSDGGSHYVYVKKGEKREKREIQIGDQNDCYVQVKKGLQEGNPLFYSSSAIIPDRYEEYKVKAKTYTLSAGNIGQRGTVAYTKVYSYTQQEDAVVDQLKYSTGDKVKRGDLICVLDVGSRGAALEELRQKMVNRTEDYREAVRECERQIAEIEKQRKSDKGILAKQMQYQRNVLLYEKDTETANYQYDYDLLKREYDQLRQATGNQGKRRIYAAQSGIMGEINIYEGKQIKGQEDSMLFQICDTDSKKLCIDTDSDYVGVGNEIEYQLAEGNTESYSGLVVGNSAVAGKYYLTRRNGKVYISSSSTESETNQAYLSLSAFKNDSRLKRGEVHYSTARIRYAIVLPAALLNEEINRWNGDDIYYYVWRLVDGNLVKQYVQTDVTLNTQNEVCILSGLEEGDVLANPITD